MKKDLSAAVVAGTVGAVLVGLFEIAIGHGPARTTWPIVLGLYLPVGIATGLSLALLRAMLAGRGGQGSAPGIFSLRDAPEQAGRILAIGLVSLFSAPIYFRVILHFMTAYKHPGLAAFTLLVALLALTALVVITVGPLTGLLVLALTKLPRNLKGAARPGVALGISTGLWLTAAAPSFWSGSEARGPYEFIGLLRLDGLGIAPLVYFSLIIVVTGILLRMFAWRTSRQIHYAGIAALVVAVSGPILADREAGLGPRAVDSIDADGQLTAFLLKVGRRLGDNDRDGFGGWFGAKDCNDHDPDINPAAHDIPDNGVDEDCTGGDLSIEALKAAVSKGSPGDGGASRPELDLSSLPEDLSLLMITIDSLRFDEPGFMGRPRNVTPSLDRLAREGTVYERAYGLGSYTGHAVPSLLTGKYASELVRNGKQEIRIGAEEVFAAERICGVAVRCGAFLSHFLFKPYHGWHQGFGDWVIVPFEPRGPGHVTTKFSAHNVASSAIDWLSDPQKTGGRFWLWLHFMDPHREYLSHPGVPLFGDQPRDRYDHEVLFTDRQVGRVLDHLRTLDIAKRTVVLVTADHGESFLEHGRYHHGKELYEEIIRVPMMVAGPHIPARRIARPTSHIDLYPTLLELFGVETPGGLHGRSLATEWFGQTLLPERPIVADQPATTLYETRRVYLRQGWKLHHLPDIGSYRLFKLDGEWETGDSLIEREPDKYGEIRAAYELFLATELDPLRPRAL